MRRRDVYVVMCARLFLLFFCQPQTTSYEAFRTSCEIMQIVCDINRVKVILTAGHNTDAVFFNRNYIMYFRLTLHFKVGTIVISNASLVILCVGINIYIYIIFYNKISVHNIYIYIYGCTASPLQSS